jgi:hypothetical protein
MVMAGYGHDQLRGASPLSRRQKNPVLWRSRQHFLLSRATKTLSLAQVFKMTDAEAETTFRKLRWSETDGAPVCPSCGNTKTWDSCN